MTKEFKYVSMKAEDNQAFFEKVDWETLCNFIEKEFGISKETFKRRLEGARNDCFAIEWEKNIAPECGFIGRGLKSARLCSFTNIIHQMVEYDLDLLEKAKKEGRYDVTYEELDAKFREPELYFTLSIRYTLINGGSNGIHMLTAWYSESDGWEILWANGTREHLFVE